MHCSQAVVPGMVEGGGGRILSILSNLINNPVVPYHDYTTAKSALLGFSRNLAAELGPHNITVNMVAGGLIDGTDASAPTTEEVRRDRKSTRLNSSHANISYAVFCLKKKKQ